MSKKNKGRFLSMFGRNGTAPGQGPITDPRAPRVPAIQSSLVPIRCPLPGMKGLRVFFETANAEVLQRYRGQAEAQNMTLAEWLDVAALLMPKFEGWDLRDEHGQLVPTPSPDDVTTYLPLFKAGQGADLLEWALGPGFRQAARLVVALSGRS